MKILATAKLVFNGILQTAKNFSIGEALVTMTVLAGSAFAILYDRDGNPLSNEAPVVVTYSEEFENCILGFADSIKPDDHLGIRRLQRTLNFVFLGRQVALEVDGARGPITLRMEEQFSFENRNLANLYADDAAFRVELARAYHRVSPETAPCTIHKAAV